MTGSQTYSLPPDSKRGNDTALQPVIPAGPLRRPSFPCTFLGPPTTCLFCHLVCLSTFHPPFLQPGMSLIHLLPKIPKWHSNFSPSLSLSPGTTAYTPPVLSSHLPFSMVLLSIFQLPTVQKLSMEKYICELISFLKNVFLHSRNEGFISF